MLIQFSRKIVYGSGITLKRAGEHKSFTCFHKLSVPEFQINFFWTQVKFQSSGWNIRKQINCNHTRLYYVLKLKLVFVASLRWMQLQGLRAKSGWFGIGIMCFEWCDMSTRELVSSSWHYKNYNSASLSSTKQTSS